MGLIYLSPLLTYDAADKIYQWVYKTDVLVYMAYTATHMQFEKF